jgi:hypothetical protein
MWRVGVVVAVAAIGLCGCGNDRAERRDRADREVRRVAHEYFVAYSAGNLDLACSYVADRMLETSVILSGNVGPGDRSHLGDDYDHDLGSPRGCVQVRARRRNHFGEKPVVRWKVDDVRFDRAVDRARVDTSVEGSYWMKHIGGRWRIVAFSPTRAAVRRFGGEWERDPVGLPEG